MDNSENRSSVVANRADEVENEKVAEANMPLNAEKTSELVAPKIRFPSCRLVLAAMGFFAFFNCYTLRINLSVAIVAMVNATYLRQLEAVSDGANETETRWSCDGDDSASQKNNATTIPQSGVVFDWDMNTQGLVLGAFFYGYAMTNIVGGMLAQKVGGKLLMLLGVFWTALLTLLTPIFTTVGGFGAIFAIRLLEGIGEAVTFPSMATLLSEWAPPLDRSMMSTFVYAGAQIGTVVGMPVSGILCQYFGWESVFYVFGVVGVVWAIMWFFLVYSSPATHPRISAEEREYIERALNKKARGKGTVRVPWLSFAKCVPLYALAVAHFTFNWGYYTLLTCLPQYFKHILHFDIKSNGLVSGAPYLFMWIVMLLSGMIADLLQKKRVLTTTNVRKLASGAGFMLPAVCLIATGYVNCSASLAVFLIIAAVGFSGISLAGFMVNHLDLAPLYAGTMMGITNTVATLPGFIGPTVVGALTYRNQTPEAWRAVFYIAASVYAFGTIFYGLFGSGQLQSWAIPPNSPVLQDIDIKVAGSPVDEKKKSAT